MIARSLWLLLSLVLGAGVPFYLFGVSNLGFVPAVLGSLVALAAAAWAVRMGRPVTRE